MPDLPEPAAAPPPPAPVLYVTDLAFDRFDPADLFDIAFLLRSPEHDLRGVCLTDPGGDGGRVLDALTERAGVADLPCFLGDGGLAAALEASPEPVNLVVVAGYGTVAEVLERDRALFRAKVARLFLVGGTVNDYGLPRTAERLPIDPRLRERNPERFRGAIEPRVAGDSRSWGRLLTSGEGVIWLPRDVCLWRYAAPGILADGGPVAEFLLRELFFASLRAAGGAPGGADRYEAADAPVLLSSAPAFLLARRPEPFAWMRLFRAVTARAEVEPETGTLSAFSTRTDAPNLYAVIAIDGRALGKILTPRLRDRPLVAP
jgi:hypothetical protein